MRVFSDHKQLIVDRGSDVLLRLRRASQIEVRESAFREGIRLKTSYGAIDDCQVVRIFDVLSEEMQKIVENDLIVVAVELDSLLVACVDHQLRRVCA